MFRMKINRALIVATTTALIATGTTAVAHAEESSAASASTQQTGSAESNSSATEGSEQTGGSSATGDNEIHQTAKDLDFTKNSSGSSEIKNLKVGGGSSKAEAWFERQNSKVQTAVIILGMMGIIGMVMGPLRVAVFNFFHI